MSDDQKFTAFPEMVMLPAMVKKPKAQLVGPDKPVGAISIGAAAVEPGYGPLLFIGMHHEDGEVLISALDAERFDQFMGTLVEIARRSEERRVGKEGVITCR